MNMKTTQTKPFAGSETYLSPACDTVLMQTDAAILASSADATIGSLTEDAEYQW